MNKTISYVFTPAPWIQDPPTHNQLQVAPPVLDDSFKDEDKYKKEPVQPLTKEQVELLRNYFFNTKDYFKTLPINRRNYLYVVLSVNLMRRCGDMVKMRVGDVLDQDGNIRSHVIFRHEEKSQKRAVVYLNSQCQNAIYNYFSSMKDGSYSMNDWLFPNYKKPGEPMSVAGMRMMLQRTCEKLGLDIHIGTHSMRRTIPHNSITDSTNTEDEIIVSQLLNHRDLKATYHYIGRRQAELDDFVERNGI